MRIPKKINVGRRWLMRALTSNVGTSHAISKRDQTIGIGIKRILISRPNARLGNLLLIAPLVQDVAATFPNCKIDLFVKGNAAPIIFRNYKNIGRILQLPGKPFSNLWKYMQIWMKIRKYHYDLVINVDPNSSSGRLSAQFSNADYKIFGETDEAFQSKIDFRHIAKNPVYNFRKYISLLGFVGNKRPIPLLDLRLTSFEIARGKDILNTLANKQKKTICLFTYATGEKCFPKSWWETLYENLKTKYPNYNIIEVLPMHDASQIDYKAPSFYSKDIRQIGSLIANIEVFIGADSGMMHLASAVQTTVIGLFSVSNIEKYKPYGNNSIAIDTTKGNMDSWLTEINNTIAGIQRRGTNKTEAAG